MRITLPDWTVRVTGGYAELEYLSTDIAKPEPFVHTESFPTGGMTDDEIARRVFRIIQFVTDHELREKFFVDGRPFFTAHADTGPQREWFVELAGAERGY